MKQKSVKGFTLLEVLVALAILAIALAAILRTTSQHVDNITYLRDKTIAHWVAMNLFTELQITHKWLAIGKENGHVAMASREWYWTVLVTETPDPELRRINIQIRKQVNEREPIDILVGFLGSPNN